MTQPTPLLRHGRIAALVQASVLALACGGPTAASPALPPLADICAALVAADQDRQTMTPAEEAVGNGLQNDEAAVWRPLGLRKAGGRVKGPWGDCPAPRFNVRYLAFSPDGRFARLDNRPNPARAQDGEMILAQKTETGWRMVGAWERLSFADARWFP